VDNVDSQYVVDGVLLEILVSIESDVLVVDEIELQLFASSNLRFPQFGLRGRLR
jgi:hypothetical protein